jgi:hypothetical protein
MARLSSDRREKFANYLVNGYNQIAAYKEAGFTCKNTTAAANASKLANTPEVVARIQELKMKAAEKEMLSVAPPLPIRKPDHEEIDLDWINREYIKLLNKAIVLDDLKNGAIILRDMAELNRVGREPAHNNNNNKMLPSNDKLPQLERQINIQVINKESSHDGRSSPRPFAIEIPDSDTLVISNSEPDEDSSS